MAFIEKIKRICKLEGISLKEFSAISGFPYGTIKNYSARGGSPKLDKIIELTQIPRFSKYSDLLLSSDNSSESDEMREFNALFDQLEKAGKGKQALDYLKYLASQPDDE